MRIKLRSNKRYRNKMAPSAISLDALKLVSQQLFGVNRSLIRTDKSQLTMRCYIEQVIVGKKRIRIQEIT